MAKPAKNIATAALDQPGDEMGLMAEEGPVCNVKRRLPPSCHEARACYAALENRPETPYFGDTETEGFEMPKTKSRARARAAAIQADTTRLAVWLGAGALVIGALIARGF